MNKKQMVSWLCLLTMLVGLFAFPAAANADEDYPYAYVIKDLSARTGPGISYSFGGRFENTSGMYVPIRSRSWDGSNELWWIEVQVEGRWLWVTYDRLDINSYSLYSLPLYGGLKQPDLSEALWGYSIKRISCRKGPGTAYESGGTYNALKGYWLPIRSRFYSNADEVWWVEVLIGVEWLWTPYERFDSSSLPLESIPISSYKEPTVPSTPSEPSDFYPSGNGETLFFGYYEQDGDFSNGSEPIEWIVLANDNGRKLLISKYCLDCQRYNEENTKVTWETCSLRRWLNVEFLYEAFSEEEQARILWTTNSNPKNPTYTDTTKNTNQTEDRVFLLSISEAEHYMMAYTRNTEATAYAKSRRAAVKENGCSWWWLRSPGCKMSAAAGVRDRGKISDNGNDVNGMGYGIRPVLWMSDWP